MSPRFAILKVAYRKEQGQYFECEVSSFYMKSLIKGQKVKISDYISEQEIEIVVGLKTSMTIDISCFGLDEKRQLSDDRYMIFYNQMRSPEDSIQMIENSNGNARFKVDLSKVPNPLKTMVFTAAIDGEAVLMLGPTSYIAAVRLYLNKGS